MLTSFTLINRINLRIKCIRSLFSEISVFNSMFISSDILGFSFRHTNKRRRSHTHCILWETAVGEETDEERDRQRKRERLHVKGHGPGNKHTTVLKPSNIQLKKKLSFLGNWSSFYTERVCMYVTNMCLYLERCVCTYISDMSVLCFFSYGVFSKAFAQ